MYAIEYERVLRLMEDWAYYEVNGSIEDCELHQATMAYLNVKGAPMADYEKVMREIAFEAYRFVALAKSGR